MLLNDLLQRGRAELQPARGVELCEALAERGVRAGRTVIELLLLNLGGCAPFGVNSTDGSSTHASSLYVCQSPP